MQAKVGEEPRSSGSAKSERRGPEPRGLSSSNTPAGTRRLSRGEERRIGEAGMTEPRVAPKWSAQHAGGEGFRGLRSDREWGRQRIGGGAGCCELHGVDEEFEGGEPGRDWKWESPEVYSGKSGRRLDQNLWRPPGGKKLSSCGGSASLKRRRKCVGAKQGEKEKVAMDFEAKGEKDRLDVFAAMPPLQAKKRSFRKAASTSAVDDCVHQEGPPERQAQGRRDDLYGRFDRWLYSMRPAASAEDHDCSTRLKEFVMKNTEIAPTVFCGAEREIRCLVHDDVVWA